MGKIRDAARTRERIVQAAVGEFAARGVAGARIERIAKAAKINKQLVYHYFQNKEELFLEIVEQHIKQGLEAATQEGPDLFGSRFRNTLLDPTWLRFVTWEAAEYPETKRIIGEDRRAATLLNQQNAILARQFRGEIPADLDAALLQLTILALATYPLVFPQITKMVTGKVANDPTFVEQWATFLSGLGALILNKNNKGNPAPMVKAVKSPVSSRSARRR
jgi:TetR/AcrR family transcriptional regulator